MLTGTYEMGFLVRAQFRAVLNALKLSGHISAYEESRSFGTSYFAVRANRSTHIALSNAIRQINS